jgi:hypothetical protein
VLRTTRAGALAGRPHGRLLFGYTRTYREGRQGPELVAQVIDEEQAAIVRECAGRVMAGESLYTIARDLNSRGTKPPHAAAWTVGHVRRMCINPGYIGKRVHQGKVVGEGQWPAILDGATFYACVSRLTDPARNTRTGVGVRHLLSGLATCGLCGSPMYVLNNRGAKSYTCRAKQHVSRREAPVDELVEAAIIERLTRPDVVDLLSAGDSGEDVHAARAEAAEKRARLEGFYDAAAAGDLTPAALARIEARLLPEIDFAERRARPQVTSPLVTEAAGPAAAEAWHRLTIEQRRELIDLLCEVRIHAAGRGKRIFDPRTVEIVWKGGDAHDAEAA